MTNLKAEILKDEILYWDRHLSAFDARGREVSKRQGELDARWQECATQETADNDTRSRFEREQLHDELMLTAKEQAVIAEHQAHVNFVMSMLRNHLAVAERAENANAQFDAIYPEGTHGR